MSIHVEYGAFGTFSDQLPVEDGSLGWSETLTSAGTTTNAVPTGGSGENVLTVTAYSGPAWVCVGSGTLTPSSTDGVANPRRYIADGATRCFRAKAGDKVAWAVVS